MERIIYSNSLLKIVLQCIISKKSKSKFKSQPSLFIDLAFAIGFNLVYSLIRILYFLKKIMIRHYFLLKLF